MYKCSHCGHIMKEPLGKCPKCRVLLVYVPDRTPGSISASNKSAVWAAVLSFLLFGGGGQLYVGQWKKGILLIIT